jgi:hypothetical protein
MFGVEVVPRDEAALDTYRSVIWSVEVRDPDKLAGGYGVGDRTERTVTDVAASCGCAFACRYDDDDEVDGIPYYKWLIRVPQSQHRRRTSTGIPIAIDEVHPALRAVLPAQLNDWAFYPEIHISYCNAVSDYLLDAYADLLDVFDAGSWRGVSGLKVWAEAHMDKVLANRDEYDTWVP